MRFRSFPAAASAAFLVSALAFAQGLPTATLTGKVTSEGNVSLPGVTVTVQSPSLQGTRDVTTSANGDSWYTEGTGFFGFMWGSKIYYCAPPTDGPAQCKEARYVEQPKVEKPAVTPGLDFYNTGVALVTDKAASGVTSISSADAAKICWG